MDRGSARLIYPAIMSLAGYVADASSGRRRQIAYSTTLQVPRPGCGPIPAVRRPGSRAVPGQVHLNLAAQANVSNDVISKIETGERPPAEDFPPRLDAVPELDTRGALTRLCHGRPRQCHRLDHPNRAYPVRSGERHLRQQPECGRSANGGRLGGWMPCTRPAGRP